MNVRVLSAALALATAGSWSVWCQAPDEKPPLQKRPTSNQMLMRDKLTHANKVLEGITLEKFDQVAESAKTLGMISRATSWHIVPTPQYTRHSKNFQEQTADLERHAKERNVEAATLDLVRMTVTCTACHQHMREEAERRKESSSPRR